MDYRPKCKTRNQKLLEENIGRTHFGIDHSNIILDLPCKPKEIKAKANKWDLVKAKRFHRAKKTRNKMKRQLTE